MSWLDGDGYVRVHAPGHSEANKWGKALVHRMVMAESIGRPLRREEVVHHMEVIEGGSGDKTDNRLENLLLFPNRSAHMAHHNKLRALEKFCHADLRE
jgi:hypothetical protein